jgi:hypothetical protein
MDKNSIEDAGLVSEFVMIFRSWGGDICPTISMT